MFRPFEEFVKFEEPVKLCVCIDEEEIEGEDFRELELDDEECPTCDGLKAPHGSRVSCLQKILNTIRRPQTTKADMDVYRRQISSKPIKRKEVLAMNDLLNTNLERHRAQEIGICPIRRHLFNSLYDEIIRQEIIISSERGLLLMRLKDEVKMSLMAYEALFEQGLNYGTRKRLEAEETLQPLIVEHNKMTNQTEELRARIKALHDEFKDQKVLSELSVMGVKKRAKMELAQLQEIRSALQAQLNQALPDIERIEKERRLRLLL